MFDFLMGQTCYGGESHLLSQDVLEGFYPFLFGPILDEVTWVHFKAG